MDIRVDGQRCIRCGECVSDCPVNILAIGRAGVIAVEERVRDCIRCYHCLAVCPTGALAIDGLSPEDCQLLADGLPDPERLERLVGGRRSVRRYLDQDVDRTALARLLEIARQAPSGRNHRQVRLTVVDDRLIMDRIRRRTMTLLEETVAARREAAELGFFREIIRGWKDYQADLVFRWAPHLLAASAPADSPSGGTEAVIALSYFELSAPVFGVGTLWNGMAMLTAELVPELSRMLGIPADHRLGYFLSFGPPAVSYARTVPHRRPEIKRVAGPVTE